MNIHAPTPSLIPHICKCGARDSDPTWHRIPLPASNRVPSGRLLDGSPLYDLIDADREPRMAETWMPDSDELSQIRREWNDLADAVLDNGADDEHPPLHGPVLRDDDGAGGRLDPELVGEHPGRVVATAAGVRGTRSGHRTVLRADDPRGGDDEVPQAVARRTDPSTSWEAARSVTQLTERQAQVLLTFHVFGAMTDEEAWAVYSYHGRQSVSGFRTRRSELVDRGLLRDTGERRRGATGRRMIVWAAA